MRRFKRKPELALLVADLEEFNKISPYAWRNMGCSGLRPEELRCLMVCLSQRGVPGQADDFKKLIQVPPPPSPSTPSRPHPPAPSARTIHALPPAPSRALPSASTGAHRRHHPV